MTDCLFCKIAGGELAVGLVYETEDLVAFRDLHPQAPVHVLIIPRRHIASLDALEQEDAGLTGRLLLAAREIARREGVEADGYRTVINCNAAGGQTVFHLHVHLLGGRQMGWPPG